MNVRKCSLQDGRAYKYLYYSTLGRIVIRDN